MSRARSHAFADTESPRRPFDVLDYSRSDQREIIDLLDEIADEAHHCYDATARVDENTLMMVDQVSDVKNEIFTLRTAMLAMSVVQTMLMCLVLWRVW
ncbi:MAG: hypothetical protein U1E46_02525 [Hyphomicrobiales bacterium]